MAVNKVFVYFLLTSWLGVANIAPAIAQSIVPAPDGTNTIVTPEGNRIDITGGMRSRDGENLFHSLLRFGLTPQEIANFLSSTEIRNILVRINGGEASFINGLIQVTGGNSNLFLMNPSGIVFGSNASLNVPASFLATTANGIGFGNNWFNAAGVNNYADLVGTPSAFAFTMNQPGSILNAGNLAVGIGQDLGLIGGTVINTGNLSAPAGNISLMAVPGQSLVRVSQPGFVLSLDLQPQPTLPQNWSLPILSLPQLLTGGSGGNATGVTVNPDGSVQLTGSGIRIPTDAGTAIASGNINASAPEGIGGTVNILGDKVGLVSANVNASGTEGGGNVRIGGDLQGKGKLPNADRTYISSDSKISVDSMLFGDGGSAIIWSDDTTEFYGSISAKGGKDGGDGGFVEVSGKDILVFNGTVDTSAPKGNKGTLLLDPSNLTILDTLPFFAGAQDANLTKDNQILSGDPDILTNTVTWSAIDSLGSAANVVLEATGNITIADVTGQSGTGTTSNNLVQLDLDTGSLRITSTNGSIIFSDPQDQIRTEGGTITLQAQGGNITAGEFNTTGALGDKFGNVILEAKDNLSVGNITTGGGNISFTSGGTIDTSAGTIDSSSSTGNGGAIAFNAAKDIVVAEIQSSGFLVSGDINFTAGGNISTPTGSSLNITSESTTGQGGNITFNAGGDITTDDIQSWGIKGGGNISLTSGGTINLAIVDTDPDFNTRGNIIACSGDGNCQGGIGQSGNVTLKATGDILTGEILTKGTLGGGNILIVAGGNVSTSKSIDSSSSGVGEGGNISVTSGGTIDTTVPNNINPPLVPSTGNVNSSSASGKGGAIAFSAPTSITAGNINADGIPDGGNISLTSNQFNFTGGNDSVSSNNGTLLLQPFTASQSLSLTPTTIAPFVDGFDSITIGRSDGTGNITIDAPIAFNDPTTIQSPGGAIAIDAPITGTDNASITINGGTNNLAANITTAEEDITIKGATTIGNNVTISTGTQSGGDITFNSTIDGNNNLTLETGTGDIFVGGAIGGNPRLGNLTINNANNVTTQAITAASITQKAGTGTTNTGALNTNSAAGVNLTGNTFNLNGNITTTNNGSFRIDNASPLTLVADKFSLDGSFNQVGKGAVSISGNLSTTNDNISFNAPVTLTGNTEFNAGTALISINSGLTGGNNNLTLTADGIELGGSVSGNGNLVLQPSTPTLAIALGIPTNSGANSLDLSQGELNNLQNGFTSITIGRADSSGTISIANSLSFQDPVTIQSPNGSILVNNPITGLDNAAITLTGNTTLNANITTNNQNLTINGNTTLGNSVTLATGGGNLLLNGTVNGNNNLTLAAGTGNITLNSLVGNNTRLGNLTINSANNVQTQSITAASIAQTGGTGNTTLGSLNTNSAAGIDLTGNTFNFNGNITTTNNGGLRINNSGVANFPATTNINLDGAFNQVGTGNVSIAGNITTTNDDIRFNSPVTLTGNTNFNPGIAAIAFNSTLDTGNNPLTLTASEIDFGGAVSGTNTLTLQPATPGQNITIGASTPGNLNLTIAEIANLQDGFSAIAIGRADGTGTISVNSVTFNDPVTIQNGVGAIAINQPISGTGNASITLDAATINLNANITTASQNLTIGRNTILGADVTLSTLNSGNIIFNGPVNGNHQLTLNAGTGSIRFNGGAGLTTPISNLNIASAQNIFVAGGISTNNNLTLNTPVTLTEDATFRTGSIVFNNTLDSEANESNNLTLNINGDISFNGAVGSIGRWGAIAIENANNLSATSTIQANSIRHLNGTGTIDLAGNITTTGEGVNLVTRNNIRTGNITSNGGQIRLTSREGTVTTGTLDASSSGSGGAIALTSPLGAVTSSDLNTSGVSSGGNITVVSGDRINTGNINASATIGNGGTVNLDPPNDIQVGFINAQGGTSGRGGNVDVTTERFFRATNAFTDRNSLNSSISTAGGLGGGTIAISHGGGDLQTPFIVGDATINGTAAALTTGINNIAPIRIFPGRFTLGNIAIITSDRLTSNLEESIIRRENPPTQRAIANIPPAPIDILVGAVEEVFTRDYETYLGKPNTTIIKTLGEIQLQLRQAQQSTGVKTAVIYIVFGRGRLGIEALLACSLESRNPEINATISQQQTCSITDNDPVEMVLVTAEGEPIRTRISGATRGQILTAARQFRINILDEENRSTNDYLEPAKQLYQWLISPLEADLKARGIQNIVFIPDAGLRTTPFAALHNGQNFVISQYSISLMPSFSLTRPRYVNLKDASVLAMGASKFTDLSPLPAVPVELSTITPQLWPGTTELNEGFTVENLKLERTEKSYRIIHLATHAQFLSGPPSNSYIQFWDKKLYLDQLDQFNWSNPPVELLVLSACRTAVGDRQVELGFAGLAVQAGVQSALASLWYVSDEGTLGLMTEFYEQLKTAPTRSEALRRAQMAMVTEEVRLENGQLLGPTGGGIPLPSALTRLGDLKFSHPYYWASFTMIGNPW